MINPELDPKALSEEFTLQEPYRHVCIDQFFDSNTLDFILSDFPAFQTSEQLNEFGELINKSVHERISDISDNYARLCEYLHGEEFHAFIRTVVGDDSVYWGGETMYGGGTHENLNGTELDSHIDFNYDDTTKEHRRLNLLIYLNEPWDEAWGGQLEVQLDPRNPEINWKKSYAPIMNRAILMETTERSWHGFPRIEIPEGAPIRSRKSLALYFYSKVRPAGDVIAGGHGTYYVHRQLPEEFAPGKILSPKLFNEVKYLVAKRDDFLNLYHEREIDLNQRFSALEQYSEFCQSKLTVPTTGWAVQNGPASGWSAEGLMGEKFSASFMPVRTVTKIVISCYARTTLSFPIEIKVTLDNPETRCRTEQVFILPQSGEHQFELNFKAARDEAFDLGIESSVASSGADEEINTDNRRFSININRIEFS